MAFFFHPALHANGTGRVVFRKSVELVRRGEDLGKLTPFREEKESDPEGLISGGDSPG